MGISEQTLMRELLDAVKKLTADALRTFRPDLTQTTGVLPGQQLPTTGNTGSGYSAAPHATTHEDGGSDEVDLGSLAGTLTDSQHGSRGNGTLHSAATTSTPGFVQLAAGGGTTAGQAVQASDTRLSDSRAPSGSAGGDLGGTYPNPTVAKLQSRTVASSAPSSGNALVWNSGSSQWEPGTASGGTPAAHASTHQHGGSDEVATATAGANAIPKAGAGGTLAVGFIPSLPATQITSGQLALARGGTAADLSATGGANQIVKQTSVGGALTVAALSTSDIPALDSAKITTGEIPRSPLTTRGDLLTQNPAGTHTRLAVGASGRYVRSDGTDPSWAQLDGADLTAASVTYAKLQNVSATDKLLGRSTAGAGAVEEIALTSAGRALIDDADASAQRTTLGLGAAALLSTPIAIASGGTGQTGATAAFNGLSPITTRGDLITRDATNNIRLAVGASGKFVRSDGTDPSWQLLVAGDIPSLAASIITSGQLALARGGTNADLSATGGANQVVKQTSAGGALSVATLTAADLPSPPRARVYNSANISIGTGSFTPLTFDSERYDTDSIHSTSTNTGRLTCQTAGSYLIIGQVAFGDNTTGQRLIRIVLNVGLTLLGQQQWAPDSAGSWVGTILTQYDLVVGDYVQLSVYQSSGGNLNVNAGGNYSPEFMMIRV